MLGVVPSSALSWPERSRSIVNPLKWTRRRKKEDIIFHGSGGAHQKETTVGMSGGVTYIDSRWSLQRMQTFWGSSWWHYPGCSCLNLPHLNANVIFLIFVWIAAKQELSWELTGSSFATACPTEMWFPLLDVQRMSSHVYLFFFRSLQTWQLLKHPAGDSDTWHLRKQYII